MSILVVPNDHVSDTMSKLTFGQSDTSNLKQDAKLPPHSRGIEITCELKSIKEKSVTTVVVLRSLCDFHNKQAVVNNSTRTVCEQRVFTDISHPLCRL